MIDFKTLERRTAKMGLFEMLSQTFPSEVVEPFGEVVIVPVKAFKEEWRRQLENENVQIYTNAYRGQACFFLRKKADKAVSKSVFEREQVQLKSVEWNEENLRVLRELSSRGYGVRRIARHFHTLGYNVSPTNVWKKLKQLGLKLKHTRGTPNPQPVKKEAEANAHSLFRELLEACLKLYPNHQGACVVLLEKAKELLEHEVG
jgi:transposase